MFRLSPIIIKTRYARIQPLPHKIFNVSIHQSGALKIYKKVTQRELCPQRPPPPPPPPKSRAWIYKTLLALAATGGIVVYCKNRPEVRDWLSIYAPWFDEFIAIMYQEADTYDQSIKRFFVWTSDTISAYINAPPKPKECMEGGGVLKFLTCKGKNNDGENKRKRKRKEVEKEEEPPEDDHEITGIVECHPPEKTEKVEAAVVAEDVPPPPKTDTLPAVEKCMEETSSTIVEYYDRAKDACLNYQATVNDEIQSYSHNSPEKIRCAMHNRMEIIEDALEKIQFANKKMKGLFRYMECIKISDEDRQKATKKYYCLVDNQDHAKHMFKIEDERALVMDQQFDLLSEKLEKFQAEMKIIGNGLDLSKEKLEFNGDPDLLLYHTMRTEKMYRQEMYDLIASNERKIHKGEERMPPQNEETIKKREILTKKVTAEKLEEITKDFKRRLDRHKENNEKFLKEALRIQTEKQQESFEKRLSQREQELMDSFQRMVAEKVNAEKANFAEELEAIRKKLRLAEAQLCAQLEKDTEVRKARELYAASASILAAANSGENVTKVNAEIKTIKNVAALDDKLTHSVIDALPDTVVNDGILPEGILIKQFYDMEKSARQVALVERDGGPLPVFILSWIQSLFLFMKMSGIPSVEAEKPPDPPFTGLDTFDLLQRARYWIGNRNLKQAVLYVKELKGASLAVANSWLKHAQTHLEAKQAAEAITAHAAAQTLKHV